MKKIDDKLRKTTIELTSIIIYGWNKWMRNTYTNTQYILLYMEFFRYLNHHHHCICIQPTYQRKNAIKLPWLKNRWRHLSHKNFFQNYMSKFVFFSQWRCRITNHKNFKNTYTKRIRKFLNYNLLFSFFIGSKIKGTNTVRYTKRTKSTYTHHTIWIGRLEWIEKRKLYIFF